MKRILVVAFVFSLSGCMSGNVGVQPDGSSSGSGAPSTPVVSSEGSHSTSGNTVPPLTDAQDLYFAIERSAALGTPAGLDFLSVQAQVETPFGFYFQGAPSVSVVYWKPVLLNGREEAAWIQQAGSGYFFETMDTSSLQQSTGITVPAASSWAVTYDASKLAGIGKDGKLFVMNLRGQGPKIVTGSTNFSPQARIQWIGNGGLAVVDAQAKAVTLFAKADPTSSSLNLQGDGFTASPSGRVMLLSSNGAVDRIIPTTGAVLASYALGLNSFASPKWNGEDQVAFVDSPATGLQIDILDVPSGHILNQIPVSAPPEQIQSICPAFVDSSLYFAAQNDQGLWAIWQTSVNGGNPQVVADTEDPTKRFVCPQGVAQ